jgi:RNA-dependent RNA polymerase
VYRRKDVSQKTSEFLPGIFSSFGSADQYYFRKEEKEDPWMRATDFTPDKSIGQSLVYVLELPTTVIEQTMNDIFKKLADFRLASYPPVFREISLQTGKAYASSQVLVPIVNAPLGIDVPFELMFKVNQLVQLGNLSGPVLGDEFYWLLQSNVMPLEHAQVALESIINAEDVCWDPVKWVKDEVEEYRKGKRQATSVAAADGLMWVRRLYVSPTKVYCMGPELEGSNRVTRHYKDHIDRFLRVSFVDENFGPVPSTALSVPTRGNSLSGLVAERSEVFDRILTVLQQGVTVGGQKFEFLAFSASQLREQSVWMFASNQALTAQSIRTWMGDFLSIRNVAKCAARMGQCFSSSTPTLEVPAAEVEHIPDIERDDEFGLFRYCFSDGIGKISKAFAVEVAKKCGAKKLQAGDSPSAFQIRYGGYKGVVAVDPKSTFKLSLRPSMRKFASTHVGLDVLSSSRFLPCFLNRQIITLLSTLGVSDSVFEQMQAAVVRQLDAMLKDPEVACEVLQVKDFSFLLLHFGIWIFLLPSDIGISQCQD